MAPQTAEGHRGHSLKYYVRHFWKAIEVQLYTSSFLKFAQFK